jgi:hypothetical protein
VSATQPVVRAAHRQCEGETAQDSEITMDVVELTHDEFETLRYEGDGIEPDTIYFITAGRDNTDMFAVSPDGVGMYWYDTQELLEADFAPSNA